MRSTKAAIFGVALLASGCQVAPPVYDEGILTLDPDGFRERVSVCLKAQEPEGCILDAWSASIIGDFAAHGGGNYALFGAQLDGMFLYSAENRSNILKWASQNCRK